MGDRNDDTEDFRHFMQIVTGKLPVPAVGPDPDEVRIRQLEGQFRALQRSMRRTTVRRAPRTDGPGVAED